MNDITVNAVSSGRTAYQVVPDPDDPIILQIEGRLSRVLDISANGFSMPEQLVEPGRRYPFSLDLPTAQVPVSGYVDVLPSGEHGDTECRFVNLSLEDIESVHHYVLIRQKVAIRSLRAAR
jgi:hypothetical protein